MYKLRRFQMYMHAYILIPIVFRHLLLAKVYNKISLDYPEM